MASNKQLIYLVPLLLSLTFISGLSAHQLENNPHKRSETLDPERKYLLEWEVHWKEKRVTFNVTVETTDWVAFGLSNDGTSSGADMIIGGVRENGTIYFSDRHTEAGSDTPVLDKHQDWALHSALETRTNTFLSFSRAFDTCDPEDYIITLNKITLIWAYGRNDNENDFNNFYAHGIYNTHILDPDYSPEIIRIRGNGDPILITKNRNENVPEDTKVWSIFNNYTLSADSHTTYVCMIHKAPRLKTKHHYIGYDVYFPNEQSRAHTHHFFFLRCHAPVGSSAREFFEPTLKSRGDSCFGIRSNPIVQWRFCTDVYMEWAIGARSFFMENNLGFPFGESEDEFYILQMHYDNFERESGVLVETRLDIFYTDKLRANEGGIMQIGSHLPGFPESVLVPPHSEDHRIFAHCGGECTKRMFPSEGITISALTLHSHNAGVGLRLRHFRGGKELPWILYDDNYDNFVQPFRHLKNDVKILPGDQLTVDCHYSTNETTFVGGYSTRQEMCQVFLIYFNRLDGHGLCGSGIISEEGRKQFLGIQNVSWVQDELEWVVNTPTRLAGLKVSEISDSIDWTPERKEELQRFHEIQTQTGHCVKEAYTMTFEEYQELPQRPPQEPFTSPINTPDSYVGPVDYLYKSTIYKPKKEACPRRKVLRNL